MIIALGSNLSGDFASSEDLLNSAVSSLANRGLRVEAVSDLWRSASWPDPSLPDYLNAIVIVDTNWPPERILFLLQDVERDFGRRRAGANAARTLDLDLIAVGRTRLETPELILPHPRAHERLFVMGPLAQIAPDWRHPALNRRAGDLAAEAQVGRDAHVLNPGSALHNPGR